MVSANRINSVDVLRLVAIIAVIVIHTTFFPSLNSPYEYTYELASQVSRYAVPFFFVLSGYFWGLKARAGVDISAYSISTCKHLSYLFLAWSLIYLLPFNLGAIYDYGLLGPIKVVYWRVLTISEEPIKFIFQGTRAHLWFLPALVTTILIASAFVRRGWIKGLAVLAIVLYIVGVLASSYANTPAGMYIYFNTGLGPFVGLILFGSGYALSGTKHGQTHVAIFNKRWLWSGIGLFVVGSVIAVQEIAYLHDMYETDSRTSYVFATYLAGLGAALVALSNPAWLDSHKLAEWGRLTLGVYLIHYAFVDLFDLADKLTSHPVWEVSYIVIVLVLSIISVKWMMRWRWTRRLVT